MLRHLRRALPAPAADLAAAQQGKISTNELVRRAETNLQRQAAQLEKSVQQKRENQASEGVKLISDWLEEHNLAGIYSEQIVQEARRIIIDAHFAGSLPHVVSPLQPVSPALIMERCRPKEPLNDDVLPSGWYSKWLARWIVFVLTDPDVRDEALDLALEQLSKR